MSIPIYKFHEDEVQEYYEARFWNNDSKQIAIVAIVTKNIDWAAYIGTDKSWTEQETCYYVAKHGCKLRELDAKYFFPDIELPYRL